MKFSIRDLMLATAVVALAVGWFVDRSNSAAKIKSLQVQVMALDEQLHGLPHGDY
ncbi:MAG: hypothetical protein IAF94_13955 [Pirellulaceae bacterium]|nr:hypothetical protein [Pirellulaceae bacterium]